MSSHAQTVHIVSRKNGVGLDRDVAIIDSLLRKHFCIDHHERRSLRALGGLVATADRPLDGINSIYSLSVSRHFGAMCPDSEC